jgi:MFS family permease
LSAGQSVPRYSDITAIGSAARATLIATLLCMGIATFLIAFVPTYQSIGIWGAVILTVLRMIQGIGVGGEWGGSVLLAMEWSRHHHHRGLIASWPQFGVPCGRILEDASIAAGRRQQLNRKGPDRRSDQEAAEGNHSICIVADVGTGAVLHLYRIHLRLCRWDVAHVAQSDIVSGPGRGLCSFINIPLSGHISDRIGRKKMYLIGAATVGLFGFLYFGMVDTAIPSAAFIAIVLSLIPHDMQYGPQAALIAEAFTPRLRYSGSSLGYQLASIIAGGPAPLIATALFAAYGTGYAIAIYIAACATVSLVAAAFMPDYTGKDISMEYDD